MQLIANAFPSQNTSGVRRSERGFSLVEVSAALGIVTFAFVSLLGLMATGVGQFREAMDTTITAQIASRIINDAQQSEFSELVGTAAATELSSEVWFRYFDEQGNEIVPSEAEGLTTDEQARAVYCAGTRVRPHAELPGASYTGTPQLAQVTVQVAHAPGEVELEVDTRQGAGQHLFKTRAGIPIHTYSALVACTQ